MFSSFEALFESAWTAIREASVPYFRIIYTLCLGSEKSQASLRGRRLARAFADRPCEVPFSKELVCFFLFLSKYTMVRSYD